MIRKLRERRRVDAGSFDTRRRVSRIGRGVYIVLLAGFFLWVFDIFLGPLLRMRADGLVVSDHISIAEPFPAEIRDVTVDPGAVVAEGQVLATVRSVELTQSIATLTARLAHLQIARTDLQSRVAVAEAVLSVARHRAAETRRAVDRMDDFRALGNVSIITWTRALQDRFDAMERAAALNAELATASAGLIALDAAFDEAREALAELRAAYNGGLVVAPRAGILGLQTVRPGDIVRDGATMMAIYQDDPYVLAYLETGTLFTINKGASVRISDGFVTGRGRIEEVLPVADTLPAEFRKVFQPRGRSRVARIALDADAPFPLFAKVTVSGIGWQSPLTVLRVGLTYLAVGLERMRRDLTSPEATPEETSEEISGRPSTLASNGAER